MNISAKKRTETPGLKEAETAVDFLSRNNFSNTEAYRILHTGSRRLNGGYELALRGKQHSEEHNISAPIYGASLSAMAEFDHVQDGHELITMALKSLQEEDSATGTSLARRIIEGCRAGNFRDRRIRKTGQLIKVFFFSLCGFFLLLCKIKNTALNNTKHLLILV